jgi:hypothetical protein
MPRSLPNDFFRIQSNLPDRKSRNGKKGISGLQLQRETGVAYKTAWRMLHQIRAAMGNADTAKAFGVLAEIDETYVGGRPDGRTSGSMPPGTRFHLKKNRPSGAGARTRPRWWG